MDEKGGRFRKKKVNFSMVSNCIIRDATISLKAKGLYALIQSYITLDNFTLYKSFLMSRCCEGERAFDSAWRELKDCGYLKMYKIREGARTFFYEYELLDEPDKPEKTENPQDGHCVDLQNVGVENEGLADVRLHDVGGTKGGTDNNTVNNNFLSNNIISNQIVSTKDVMEQIGYEAFSNADLPQIDEIVMLMCDVLNTPDDNTIRIAKLDKPSSLVKARFTRIDHFNVEYVLECLQKSTGKISNMRSYLLTALYNAPSTMQSYYQNQVNHDLYGT